MFEPTSRYARLPVGVHVAADGREIPYAGRRFLPAAEDLPLLTEATVADGERLDQVAGRTLGDPTQWWRIADASNATDPPALAAEPGTVLRVPVPQPE